MARTVQQLKYELTADNTKLVKGMKDASKRLDAFGSKCIATGKKLTKGLTAPILAVGAGMVKLATDAGKTADKLLDLEQITGLSTDTLQEMEFVAAEAGVSFDGLTSVVTKFTNRLPTLEDGTSEGAQAFAKLGVSLRDAQGELRDTDELFPELIKSLQNVENETERNVIAQQVFGRSLTDLAPVLGLTNEEFDGVINKARESGLVMSKDALNGANDFRKEMDFLKLELQKTGFELGNELIPIVKDNLLPIFKDVVGSLKDVIKWVGSLSPETIKMGLAIAGVAAAAGPAATAIGGISKALSFLSANPILLVAGAVAALTIALVDFDKVAKETMSNVSNEIVDGLKKDVENLSGSVKENLEKSFLNLSNQGTVSIDKLRASVNKTAAVMGHLPAELIDIGLAVPGITDEFRKQLTTLREEAKATETLKGITTSLNEQYKTDLDEISAAAETLRTVRKESVEAESLITGELAEQVDLINEMAVDEQAEARKAALQEYLNQLEILNNKQQLSILSEKEALLEQQRIVTEYRDALLAAKYTGKDGFIGDAALNKTIEDLEIINAALATSQENRFASYIAESEAFRQKEQKKLDYMIWLDGEEARLSELRKARAKEEEEAERKRVQEQLNLFQAFYGSISTLAGAYFDAKKALAGEDDAEQKRIAKEQFELNKALQLANIGINTAAAIIGFLANPGGIPGTVLSVLAGITGAVQAAAVLATPAPAFAEGVSDYMVPSGFPNDTKQIYVQSGERVNVETPAQQVINDRQGGNITINNMFSFASDAEMERAARKLYPYMERERQRIG